MAILKFKHVRLSRFDRRVQATLAGIRKQLEIGRDREPEASDFVLSRGVRQADIAVVKKWKEVYVKPTPGSGSYLSKEYILVRSLCACGFEGFPHLHDTYRFLEGRTKTSPAHK